MTAWGSSQDIPSYRATLPTLLSEAYVMHADGSGTPARLTHFNTPGYPESTPLEPAARKGNREPLVAGNTANGIEISRLPGA